MKRQPSQQWQVLAAAIACLSGTMLVSCQPLIIHSEAEQAALMHGEALRSKGEPQVCETPTVENLAKDLDNLERHIDTFGSVVAQHPDVWGQARMTKHREEFEREMAKEFNQFAFTLQASVSRSDQAYAADAFALSATASAAGSPPGGNTGPNLNVQNNPDPASKPPAGPTPMANDGGATTLDKNTFDAFTSSNLTRTGVGTITAGNYSFPGGGGINIEPEIYLAQKTRYLNFLNELRRKNEGDDTADSPGYALNLVSIPVSILPGKRTDIGHGAEITMTLEPHLNEDLLPTTFRNLVINDVIDQISYPLTQFINSPANSIYLDDRRRKGPGEIGSSADLANDFSDLCDFMDDPTQKDSYGILKRLRYSLVLQPLFQRSEWDWVDDALEVLKEVHNRSSTGEAYSRPNRMSKKGSPENWTRETVLKNYASRFAGSVKISQQPCSVVPGTKSRRATLPIPPIQLTEVYGFKFTYEIALEAYRTLGKERFSTPCADGQIYIHMPDVQGFLHEELIAAHKLLSTPQMYHLWHAVNMEDLANTVRAQQREKLGELRRQFVSQLTNILNTGDPSQAGPREATIAMAWALVVESALLNQQLIQDMGESAAAKGCVCANSAWLDYYLPNPSPEARHAFNEYVKCRWPIHVFALDPETQQQNIGDVYSSRREMQLAMSLAFVSGNISASNMMRYARRIELDTATIALNNTQVGFSHGDNTFGWRFYPRYQTPDIESNAVVFFRDLLWGGPRINALLRQRRLEPGKRECVAIVIMPSFVPYADLHISSNWFSLVNPKQKLMDAQFAMRLSKAVKTIETCGTNVVDSNCYREGDFNSLLYKAKQLSDRLPYQSTAVQIPFENTLGGFAMFNTGVTDLAPELTGWYGTPSINPNKYTTLFLVGNHFSVHQTRIIAGGNSVICQEMLSRQVVKVVIPPMPILTGDAQQKFVDIHLATPYGVSQHLLVPTCADPCGTSCDSSTGMYKGVTAPPCSTPPPPADILSSTLEGYTKSVAAAAPAPKPPQPASSDSAKTQNSTTDSTKSQNSTTDSSKSQNSTTDSTKSQNSTTDSSKKQSSDTTQSQNSATDTKKQNGSGN